MAGVSQPSLRVAVEGCGHGTLHAIYASVEHACAAKGWDSVDVLIIGGDFQAVRNAYDLNVTAMPQKYRQMADFHEYYSGQRVAPYLTVFIGGNHEASNHLFELYYGGWVATNIYYLGAANVLRLGPMRVAGLSGIWKGYDYRKSHFERLPYNTDDITSIFHVRELDVRKLLSLRTQVDVGLSHDWPQGIEWHGDHKWLFNKRKDFSEDAQTGKLGNVAAKQCLERLRPPYWFSAHLHTKYAAVVQHGEYRGIENRGSRNTRVQPDQPQLSAWKNFQIDTQRQDTEDRDRVLQELQNRKDEEERTGTRSGPSYTFNETFKKVTTNGSLGRTVTAISSETDPVQDRMIQMDGCSGSKMVSLKRRRDASNSESAPATHLKPEPHLGPDTVTWNQRGSTETTAIPTTVVSASVENPDAIDIDMSDEDDSNARADGTCVDNHTTKNVAEDNKTVSMNRNLPTLMDPPAAEMIHQEDLSKRPQSNKNGNGDAQARWSSSLPGTSTGTAATPEDDCSKAEASPRDHDTTCTRDVPSTSLVNGTLESPNHTGSDENEISDDVRAQLAELSTSFAPDPEVEVSPVLPLPSAISNTTTQFLALGKCEAFQEFLQLIEVDPVSESMAYVKTEKPLKLQYDPEWLAILRVFAPELSIGSKPDDPVPVNRGDTYYRDRIVEEEKWVAQNIVETGRLEIPENFSTTAPVYDPDLRVTPEQMPREVTNPQTSAFCELIGVDNPFDMSEEDRDARIAAGPRADRPRYSGGDRSGNKYNHRGGRGRGGYRGGGRGRGRGGW